MSLMVYPGDRVAGRYLLESELGRGGHGTVFRAIDTEEGKPVAVKVLNGEVADQDQYVLRLWREAQSLAALWGTSVVQVHEFDTDPRGFVYMVMELLQGDPLDEYLYELESFGDRMSPAAVIDVLEPVANALGMAHSKGIIHRDVKPPNIFIVDPAGGGGTRLMDFGLAKTQDFEEITDVGMIAGSPSYISPEIWNSQPFDHRIDIYSFGAVVFRMLSGQPPFVAGSTLELYELATKAPRPRVTAFRPELEPAIDTWMERALAIDVRQRYNDMNHAWGEFLEAILQSGTPSLRKFKSGLFRR
ncbi:MAG TPA: serine/threonine-protein kinase [Polyangiaceae bacterium]|jgi:serine/threonine-protein kinase|nr:serine/threonine-protein kinase [Polyangiaceae bacterium]